MTYDVMWNCTFCRIYCTFKLSLKPMPCPAFDWLNNVEYVFFVGKQGNRLTRRPCKGDEFEIVIFEGKRENAGICRSRQKMCTTWTFISIGRRVTQE